MADRDLDFAFASSNVEFLSQAMIIIEVTRESFRNVGSCIQLLCDVRDNT